MAVAHPTPALPRAVHPGPVVAGPLAEVARVPHGDTRIKKMPNHKQTSGIIRLKCLIMDKDLLRRETVDTKPASPF